MNDRITIAADGISASITPLGAELSSLSGPEGGELLWQGGPEWPRRAPILFPIVGSLAGNALRHGGMTYRMTQHGFARDRPFAVVDATPTRAALRLGDDTQSRSIFPFAFELDVIYVAEGSTLTVTTRVSNPGEGVLPCGVGAHPGFRWPLVDGIAKADHAIQFDRTESGEALSVEGGLIGAARSIPLDGHVLPLSEGLFADDALVLPDVASRSVRYVAKAPDGSTVRALAFSWEGYRDLGIWSKPTGAPFLCIEPWYSMASPVGWDGEFADKPGILHLQPGEAREFVWRVTV
ncbi:aldose 1-epimerase family protein [Aureimonas sp. SK2]|uniref:aldose 1-epimerase family protein n=1 Tax=Aureimonas sp. SK2 TaxID=3015992 RepID=UPI002443E620|nr:aldose 1-epimerase family protein [Aureimonas sp. SK2]